MATFTYAFAGLPVADYAAGEAAPRRLVVTGPDGNTLTVFQDRAAPDG
jgi:hypothetical protein